MKVTYRDISLKEVAIIKEVWEKNRLFHEATSQFFGHLYHSLIFEERMAPFEAFGEDQMKITIAEAVGEEESQQQVIGYCLSTIDGHEGQMQTLHVLEEFRGKEIGKELMQRHLEWLKDHKCEAVSLVVSQENEKAIRFYENHGFQKNTIEMRLIQS
ncbi:GNAT family N-acetyltransferase [Anoxynatronum sibiricum]|uniref:GNAT family N-acetyltransferase n=1 Tax=Anoxynatronum sibiricum TaxID=210623 RepID=A0ABU9VVY3_9CLOT